MGLKVHFKTNGISSVWLFVGDVSLLQEGDCISEGEISVFLTVCFTLMGLIYFIRSVGNFFFPAGTFSFALLGQPNSSSVEDMGQ